MKTTGSGPGEGDIGIGSRAYVAGARNDWVKNVGGARADRPFIVDPRDAALLIPPALAAQRVVTTATPYVSAIRLMNNVEEDEAAKKNLESGFDFA